MQLCEMGWWRIRRMAFWTPMAFETVCSKVFSRWWGHAISIPFCTLSYSFLFILILLMLHVRVYVQWSAAIERDLERFYPCSHYHTILLPLSSFLVTRTCHILSILSCRGVALYGSTLLYDVPWTCHDMMELVWARTSWDDTRQSLKCHGWTSP